jgi:hypothetical protein
MTDHDWWEWHRAYDIPGSRLHVRTEIVHRRIRECLDWSAPGAVRILSPCAGQGRELLPVIASHPRRTDVRARLVELDPRNVAAACDAVTNLRLDWNVEIVRGDASVTDAYVGAVPANLVVLCGIFGCIDEADAETTITVLPELVAPGAMVVWTLQPTLVDLAASIRTWFRDAGFREHSFESAGLDASWVGVSRFAGTSRPLTRGVRLFTFRSSDERSRA